MDKLLDMIVTGVNERKFLPYPRLKVKSFNHILTNLQLLMSFC